MALRVQSTTDLPVLAAPEPVVTTASPVQRPHYGYRGSTSRHERPYRPTLRTVTEVVCDGTRLRGAVDDTVLQAHFRDLRVYHILDLLRSMHSRHSDLRDSQELNLTFPYIVLNVLGGFASSRPDVRSQMHHIAISLSPFQEGIDKFCGRWRSQRRIAHTTRLPEDHGDGGLYSLNELPKVCRNHRTLHVCSDLPRCHRTGGLCSSFNYQEAPIQVG